MSQIIDMTGWKMWEHGVPDSRLTVLYRGKNSKDGRTQWVVSCNCGNNNPFEVNSRDIRNGHTLSCGCLHRERTSAANKSNNIYDLSGEYGVGWTNNTNREFYFDLEDYDKIKDYCWYEHYSSENYSYLRSNKPGGGYMKLHWVVLGKYVDHIDNNPMNNRKSNLRFADHKDNMKNQKLGKNNTSGVTGVSIHQSTGKWRARIMINHKEKSLGLFADKDSAIKARLNAERDIYGQWAPQQHLFEQYGVIV